MHFAPCSCTITWAKCMLCHRSDMDCTGTQAVSKAEGDVSEAQKRLLELERQKEELDKQLQQTQKAVLDGKEQDRS